MPASETIIFIEESNIIPLMAIERQFVSDSGFEAMTKVYFAHKNSSEPPRLRRYSRIKKPNLVENDPIGQISVNYDGTLSEKLEWSQDILVALTRRSDLRSNVKISSSGELDGNSDYVSLGHVAAWKRLGNSLELFRRRLKTSSNSSVDTNERMSAVEITLKDQQISKTVREKNNGVFDNGQYVQELNSIVRGDLQRSLNWEKLNQIKQGTGLVTFAVAGTATFIIIEASAAYICIQALKDFSPVIGHFVSDVQILARNITGKGVVNEVESSDYIMMKMALGFAKGLFGMGIATLGFNAASGALHGVRERMNGRNSRYMSSLKDLNPLKHVSDLVKGSVYLSRNGKNLVELKEQDKINIAQ